MSTDLSAKKDVPADGTLVRLKRGMPGTYEGQSAIVHHQHPTSGHSNLSGEHPLVWLECEVIWSHGTADGFWAARPEYVVPVHDTRRRDVHPLRRERRCRAPTRGEAVSCLQEDCANWDGDGCPCRVLDLEPVDVRIPPERTQS
jgi:hypothetical protein